MWSKEMIELLIIKYQENENVYNVRSPFYLDRVKRANSLFSMCQALKEINKDITIDDINKKIHTLRAQYIRESRAIANSKRSEIGADDVYVPKLWCFSHLHFLKSHCTIRKSESNISETDENDSSFLNDTNAPETISPAPPKKDNNLDEQIESVKSLITKKAEQKSKWNWLDKQVVFQIDKITNEQIKEGTAWEIQQLLRNAIVKDKQSSASSIFTPPPEATFIPIRASSTSFSTQEITDQSSSQSTPDILQQSLMGILDDDDF